MNESEVSWERMFTFALPNPVKAKSTKCACGGKNCQTAKNLKCVCRCHSEFHGAANRKGMEPLDKALGLDREPPKPLADLALDLELSGRLEFP